MPRARIAGKSFPSPSPAVKARPPMTSYESDLLRLPDERGYIHQMTDPPPGLDALQAKQIGPSVTSGSDANRAQLAHRLVHGAGS